jgi:hypothetical protein
MVAMLAARDAQARGGHHGGFHGGGFHGGGFHHGGFHHGGFVGFRFGLGCCWLGGPWYPPYAYAPAYAPTYAPAYAPGYADPASYAAAPPPAAALAAGDCREYRMPVTIGGRPETAYGVACRQPDGTWRTTTR